MNYLAIAATARRLIAQAGQTVTLKSQVTGDYDPAQGKAPVTNQDQAAVCVILNYKLKDAGQKQKDGTLILGADKKLLMSAATAAGFSPEPAVNDKLQAGSTTYTILNIKDLAPAGTPVLYECQVRK